MFGSISRTFLQSPSSSSKVGRRRQAVLREEALVVVEVLRHGIHRDAEVLAVEHERGLPAFGQRVAEAALGVAELADVEREPVADEARRVLAGPVEEDVRRVGADERDLDRRLVGLVREILEDDLDVGMGLLVFGLGEFDEGRIALGLQVPLLDGHGLGGSASGRPSNASDVASAKRPRHARLADVIPSSLGNRRRWDRGGGARSDLVARLARIDAKRFDSLPSDRCESKRAWLDCAAQKSAIPALETFRN